MTDLRIADLTVSEFKKIVHEVIVQSVADSLGDPDEGLALRDDFAADLRQSLTEVEAGGKMTSLSDVAAKLGLSE